MKSKGGFNSRLKTAKQILADEKAGRSGEIIQFGAQREKRARKYRKP